MKIEDKVRNFLYKRFNDFKTNVDYEEAGVFLFNVYKGSTTVIIDRDVLEYICENYDTLFVAILSGKY